MVAGSLFGTLLGVLVITLIGNGLVLLGINSFFQQVVRGVIIVVAVLANILLTQRSSKSETLNLNVPGAGAAGMKINRIVNEGFMKTMLAAYLRGNSTVDLREVAVPTPGINGTDQNEILRNFAEAMSTISTTNTALRRRHPINRYTGDLSTVMNRARQIVAMGARLPPF